MTKEAIIEEIKKHSKKEQRKIIEAVWQPSQDDYQLTELQCSELKHRYEEYIKDPTQGSTWKEVRARIEGALTE